MVNSLACDINLWMFCCVQFMTPITLHALVEGVPFGKRHVAWSHEISLMHLKRCIILCTEIECTWFAVSFANFMVGNPGPGFPLLPNYHNTQRVQTTRPRKRREPVRKFGT